MFTKNEISDEYFLILKASNGVENRAKLSKLLIKRNSKNKISQNIVEKIIRDVRKNGDVSFLRPDGKAQVTIEYSYGKPKRIHTVVLSTQHDPNVSQKDIETALFKNVINIFSKP